MGFDSFASVTTVVAAVEVAITAVVTVCGWPAAAEFGGWGPVDIRILHLFYIQTRLKLLMVLLLYNLIIEVNRFVGLHSLIGPLINSLL